MFFLSPVNSVIAISSSVVLSLGPAAFNWIQLTVVFRNKQKRMTLAINIIFHHIFFFLPEKSGCVTTLYCLYDSSDTPLNS